MNALKAARQAVAEIVSATVPCQPFYPERINPGSALVQAADPYLTDEGATFGAMTIRLEVRLVAPPGLNERQTDDLDTKVQDIIVDLINADWSVSDVSQPYTLLHGQQSFTAISITTSNAINL